MKVKVDFQVILLSKFLLSGEMTRIRLAKPVRQEQEGLRTFTRTKVPSLTVYGA